MSRDCDSCGRVATHWRDIREETPTDRGIEVRCYVESLCDQCWDEQGYEPKDDPQ